MKAKITAISRDFDTGYPELQIIVKESFETVERYKGKSLEIEIKEDIKGRSLNANAYYWTLCNKLAGKFGVSNAWMHNSILQRYGTYTEISGQCLIVSINAEEDVMENQHVHLKPTGQPGEYILLKGSHEYNQKEMARLIDGLIEECKLQGIETLPQEEIDRMVKTWKAS